MYCVNKHVCNIVKTKFLYIGLHKHRDTRPNLCETKLKECREITFKETLLKLVCRKYYSKVYNTSNWYMISKDAYVARLTHFFCECSVKGIIKLYPNNMYRNINVRCTIFNLYFIKV